MGGRALAARSAAMAEKYVECPAADPVAAATALLDRVAGWPDDVLPPSHIGDFFAKVAAMSDANRSSLIERTAEAERKRLEKGCDLMMVNPVDRDGQGFGKQPNGGWLLGEGWNRNLPVTTKLTLSHQLLDALFNLRDQAAALVDS